MVPKTNAEKTKNLSIPLKKQKSNWKRSSNDCYRTRTFKSNDMEIGLCRWFPNHRKPLLQFCYFFLNTKRHKPNGITVEARAILLRGNQPIVRRILSSRDAQSHESTTPIAKLLFGIFCRWRLRL